MVEGLSRLKGKPLGGISRNCYVDGATIVGVPFCGLKGIRIKTMEICHKIQPVSKLRDRFL